MLQSGFVSFFEKELQGLSRTIKVNGNPSPLIQTIRRPRKMSMLSGLNLNKMQGLSLDPQGQSKLSAVINNEASILSGCPYSAV